MSHADLVLRLLLQLAVILVACRLVGLAGRALGQTQVVGEMIAGVLLGPSLFGLIAPAAQSWLFPKVMVLQAGAETVTFPHPSMSILYALSQIGLVIYMFLVGLEFNSDLIAERIHGAGMVSLAGIAVPFVLGGGIAFWLHTQPDLFAPGLSRWAAALFLGASMSITAFPMLARILSDKGIAGTRLGTLALAAGSVDDALAWCLLAVVLAFLKKSALIAVLAIGGGAAYGAGMILAGRPLLRYFSRRVEREGRVTTRTLVNVLLLLMLAAWFTDEIGIYAVFGAFIFGTAMPRGPLAAGLRAHTEAMTSGFLLPLFFVFSGLNTQISLVNTPRLWAIAGVIVVAAIAGKGLACMFAARGSGETWRAAATIGTLMNARGLMELIILNIGLQQGIITPSLFTIMVMMAVLTTLMTSPLFEAIWGRRAREQAGEGGLIMAAE